VITAARAIVNALLAAGVDHAFCVPGESYLDLLDALYDEPRIRVIATRHEGAAAFMAEAYAKVTRKPTVCMGTRMVGSGNLAIGLHTARHDSSPVIALLGQVSTTNRYRDAFQEVDLAHAFAPVVKWAVEPPRADRLGELVFKAAREAVSGRPGPVVVSLREDILDHEVPAFDPAPLRPPRPAPDPASVRAALDVLRTAERPLMLLGGGALASGATEALVALAEKLHLPTMVAWRRGDAFPNSHPLFIGQTGLSAPPSLIERFIEADVVLAIGTRLGENVTQNYQAPSPSARLIHVDIAAEALGGHLGQAAVACQADARLFAEALLNEASTNPLEPARRQLWERHHTEDKARIERDTTPNPPGVARSGYADQLAVVRHVKELLPKDAIVTLDAGNFAGWPARYLRWDLPMTYVGPTSGAMGYGVPAAVASKLAFPERPVVCFVGDGGFLMTGVEIETSIRENAPIVILVQDNQQYGTIRMHQIREHPGRQMATKLGEVDYAAFARSLGAEGFSVTDEAEFPAAFKAALAAGKTALIHLRVDPEQISVGSDPKPTE
jgi:acetolactate synthase-1/2/3 large subunit